MGMASGSDGAGAGGGAVSIITDEEVRQIAAMADRMEVDEDEIDAIVEAVQLEQYQDNIELAQE